MARYLKSASTWQTYWFKEVAVKRDANSQLVTIEATLLLDGDAIAVGHLVYRVDLLLHLRRG